MTPDTRPTTLSEFSASDDTDSGDETATAERDDAPTPAENARDIEHLVALVQELSDQVGTVAGELEQRDTTTHSTEDIDSDPTGMFH